MLAGAESSALLQFVELGASPGVRLGMGSIIPLAVTRAQFVTLIDLGGCAIDGWGGLHLGTLARLREETP